MRAALSNHRPYSAFAAGTIFGIAWWLFADAVVYSAAMLNMPFNALWLLPGVIATVSILLMNTVTPDDVTSDTYGDEAATVRPLQNLLHSFCDHCMATSHGSSA